MPVFINLQGQLDAVLKSSTLGKRPLNPYLSALVL